MAKAKRQPLEPDQRSEILDQAARLSAASGEDALMLARMFEEWLARAGEHGMAALRAAILEASERHDHLRGRHPNNGKAVLEQADRFAGYIAGRVEGPLV